MHAAPDRLKAHARRQADVVLSDMAANATGHRQTDHLRIMALAEAAADFAREVLADRGSFLCKVLQGGTEADFLAELKRDFASVKHVKPPASRSDSAELYLLARGFRGPQHGWEWARLTASPLPLRSAAPARVRQARRRHRARSRANISAAVAESDADRKKRRREIGGRHRRLPASAAA